MIAALFKKTGLNISEENFKIRAEQIRTLVQAYPAMIAANMVMAPLLAALMWHKLDHALLLSWVALLYAFHALEIRHWLRYPKTIDNIKECKRWQMQFLLSDSLVGAAWGSAGVFMFIPGEPLLQAFLLCIMMGMAAAAVAGNLVFPLSQQTYVALVILPILSMMLAQGNREYYILSGMVGIFLLFVMKTGRDQSKLFEKAIQHRFDNIELADKAQQANEQLRLSDELLRQSQAVAKLGSWRLNRQGNELLWSDETYRIFDVPRGTYLDYDFFMTQVYPDDREMLASAWQNALNETGYFFVQHRIVVHGEIRWIEERAELHFDAAGNFSSGTGSAQDITGRKHLEATRQEALDRFQKITQLVPGSIYQLQLCPDGSFRIPYVSDAFRKIYRIDPKEIYADASKAFVPIHPDDRKSVMSSIQASARNLTPWQHEYRLKFGDGTERWVLGNSLPQREADGSILWYGFITDITERKLAEARLFDSLRKLEEKELAKTRFLAAAGHDLRQPVAAANLFVDALKLSSPSPRQVELIERLDQSMNVFSGLLERLLDISKFDAGLIQPQMTSFNLAELFNWLEQNFAQTALEKNLRFRLFFPLGKSLSVRTDIGLLQSVLMNLVTNAIKFTAQGGILISARQRGNTVLVQVWDTGIGIPEAEIPHIFDEFYQVANPQRSREAGLGLGLSICQRALTLLDSAVTCRSRPGRGSVFGISLPLHREQHNHARTAVSDIPANNGNGIFLTGKSVMVVEDDTLVATGMTSLLQGLGAEIRLFHNAEEALQHKDLAGIDYFIVDYALGGELSGVQFLRSMQQKRQKPLSAVVITGETSSQFISSIADSPWPVLHKPVNYTKLLSSLRP